LLVNAVSNHVRSELYYGTRNNPYGNTMQQILNMVPEYPKLEDYINNPTKPTHPITNGTEDPKTQINITNIGQKVGDNSIYTLDLTDKDGAKSLELVLTDFRNKNNTLI